MPIQFTNFRDFISANLLDGSQYHKGVKVQTGPNEFMVNHAGYFKDKNHVVDFAQKLFNIQGPFASGQNEGESDQIFWELRGGSFQVGKLERSLNSAAMGDLNTGTITKTFSGHVNVEFDGKTLHCSFYQLPGADNAISAIGKVENLFDATCEATDNRKPVVEGGQWISWVPYAVGAVAAYCGIKAVIAMTRITSEVIFPKLQEAVTKASKENPKSNPILDVALELVRDHDKIKTSKGESIGKVFRRIFINAIACSALIGLASGIYKYDAQYVRI